MPVESVREFYHWQPAEKRFSVQMNFDAIDRIHVDVMRGFGAVRRRGAEVGGLLLGTIIPGREPIVTIYDFEPVPCEYAMGPSYLLSENDLQKLRQLLDYWSPSPERDMYAVGFFRSHTRDALGATAEDLAFFEKHFPDPASVLLLIKPFATKPSIGGFLFREGGAIRSTTPYLEFPFQSKELSGTTVDREPFDAENKRLAERFENLIAPDAISEAKPISLVEHPIDVEPAPIPAAPQENHGAKPIPLTPDNYQAKPIREIDTEPMFADFHPSPSRFMNKVGWVLFSVALIGFGSVAGYQYAEGTSVGVSTAVDPYALNLSATRVDENILVQWDRSSPAVHNGWRGLLTITEGQESKVVQMDVPQLQNGSVLYRHLAAEVHFKLEVFLKEQRSVVESLTFRLQQ